MILEKQKEASVIEEGSSQESIGMSLDLDSAQVLMQMLSKNLYSDAIGSTIRECASNALDSHRRAGTTDPIIVSLKINSQSNWEFSVEDFGIGLDADDVRSIISKYGKSTKRDSANELGMMGLGFKAPLAYSSSFYFVCRKDGMERKYMMYEGEDVNTIDMLYEKPTKERNGVKVIVPLKFGDRHSFQLKIREQLAYFESVFFDCGDLVNNDFQIVRHEHFQWSPLSNDSYLHICLDNVYYSLEFSKLGIDRINFPIALRFGLSDGIFPTPNRESIRYTKEAKDAIMEKIKLVADYFVEKYNESVTESEDVYAVIEFLRNEERFIRPLSGTGGGWKVNELKKYTTKKFAKPKLKGIELLDMARITHMKDYILEEWVSKFYLNKGKLYSKSKRAGDITYYDLQRYKFYKYTDKLSELKKDWIRTTLKSGAMLVKKEKRFKLGAYKQTGNGDMTLFRNLLLLDGYPRNQWRQIIEEFYKIVDMFTSKWEDLDKLEVPIEFINSRKKQKSTAVVSPNAKSPKKRKMSGEIIGKEAVDLERYYSGRSCKFVSKIISLSEAHKLGLTVIYGSQDDEPKMHKLYQAIPRMGASKPPAKLMLFSKRELAILQNVKLHNWVEISKFMEGKHILFRRVVGAHLISNLRSRFTDTFNKDNLLGHVSKPLYDDVDALCRYYSDNSGSGDSEFLDEMVKTAETTRIYDWSIHHTYLKVKAFLEKHRFIEAMLDKMYTWDTKGGMMSVLRDMFRYKRIRMDIEHYNTVFKVKEEEQTEE